MGVKYAKLIFSAKSGKDGVYTYDGGMDAGSKGVCIFTLGTTDDATDLSHIGAHKSAAATTVPIILGIACQGTPLTQDEATPYTKGAIVIESISILTNGTITASGGATATVEAYRLYSDNGTTTGWGSYRILTGTTASVAHVTQAGGTARTRIYDVSKVSTADVVVDTAAIDDTLLMSDKPQVLRNGDMLCLSLGANAPTAGTATIALQVHYTRLNKNARLMTAGSRYDGNVTVTAT